MPETKDNKIKDKNKNSALQMTGKVTTLSVTTFGYGCDLINKIFNTYLNPRVPLPY